MSEINTHPVVSVCMITYNHEPYIAEAIEGVLMQQTNFPIELVIGEDCSTDRTREICLAYQRKYPSLIRLIANEQNMGMMPNFVQTLQACQGKYVAMCEGDDYWTDPLKLQKQVDFLEAHLDYSGCCTGFINIDNNNNLINCSISTENVMPDIRIENLLMKNYITTCTAIIKRKVVSSDKKINYLVRQKIGDLPLWLICSLSGPIRYMPEKTSAYRNNVGVSKNFRNNFLYFNLSLKVRSNFIKCFHINFNKSKFFYSVKPYYLMNYAIRLSENGQKFRAITIILSSFFYLIFTFLVRNNIYHISVSNQLRTFAKIVLRK